MINAIHHGQLSFRQRDLLIALSTPKTSVNLIHVQVPKRQLWRAIGSPPTQCA
jgi:hypothetical protein